MPDALLATRELDAFYGDFQALFGVEIAIEPGEVIAIIGANGAGKTTLMRSITGLLNNSPEMVTYRGHEIGSLRADLIARRGIAMVPEGRQLFQSLSVEENLIIGGQMGRKGPWTLERIFELFPVLKERRAVPATALSGGQQQMVAIGRALMSNPDLLLFDEISLGLAPIIIKSIYDALPNIIGDGMSTIIVEQDIAKALSVATRVYCMQEGRISLEGRSDALSREQISAAYFGV
ncbi:MAG: ABC transporter ATP-binding protein [Roseibium sp.]|uniref:ABC transporter ATP-binding protein n=1 Tax=Roseibium sp. TaxID=1936156 RepID=UPI001B0CBEFA|nr:ABC transporter ATP-binding protein [Roseibium sp.]MBO6893925.1 ABC transporter ATP-binding protein [Roseibium sp.]MBO6931360.1 ABC transporter ATP-binding protein [Roseibium sp.]